MRTRKEVIKTLMRILSFYDSYRIVLKMNKKEAIEMVLETYDDFYEWLKGEDELKWIIEKELEEFRANISRIKKTEEKS